MKRFISFLLIFSIVVPCFAEDLSPNVKAACLISADTGEVLYQKNADTPLPNASTTKILTALIIIEDMDINGTITTPDDFTNPGESNIAINYGETFVVKDLLYALLVQSANDASKALAIAHSGSTAAFAEVMNKRAKELGAVSSNFVTSSGLHDDAHLVTAKDMATIATKAMQNPTFRELVKTISYTIPPTNKQPKERAYLHTHNLFLFNNGKTMNYNGKIIRIYDERIEGIKTGYTSEAQNCLVSSIKQEGSRYIAVVFGAPNTDILYGTSKRLLDYALDNFERIKLIGEGEVVTNIKVDGAKATGLNLVSASTIIQSLPKNAENDIKITPKIQIYEDYPTPIKMGTTIGKAIYTLSNGKELEVDLLAQRDIAARDFVGELTETLSTKNSFGSWLDIVIFLAKLLLTFLIWRGIVMHMRRARAKKIRQEKLKAIRASYQTSPVKSNVVNFRPRNK